MNEQAPNTNENSVIDLLVFLAGILVLFLATLGVVNYWSTQIDHEVKIKNMADFGCKVTEQTLLYGELLDLYKCPKVDHLLLLEEFPHHLVKSPQVEIRIDNVN